MSGTKSQVHMWRFKLADILLKTYAQVSSQLMVSTWLVLDKGQQQLKGVTKDSKLIPFFLLLPWLCQFILIIYFAYGNVTLAKRLQC